MTERIKKIKVVSALSAVFLGSLFSLPFATYAGTNQNLIANQGLETASSTDVKFPEQWNQGFWGVNDAVFSYTTPSGDGTKAAKVEIAHYTDGDAKWFFNDVPVHSGEQYVFTDNYAANVLTDVIARYTLQNGEYRYVYLGTPIVSTAWTGYATLPFTVPKDAVSLTVFHLIHEPGALSIDNVSLHIFVPAPTTTEEPPKTVPTPTVSSVGGGSISLAFLTRASGVSAPATTPLSYAPFSNNNRRQSPNVSRDFEMTRAIAPETKSAPPVANTVKNISDDIAVSFIHTAEATAKTAFDFSPKKPGLAPLGTLADDGFPDLTIVFAGVILIMFSIGITLLLISENNQKTQEAD